MKRTNIINASGVYQIQSKINGKIYIGSSFNVKGRKAEHFNCLKLNSANRHMQNHYNKYGKKDLVFSIIEFCPKEKLLEREQYWMDTLKPEFNINPTAGSNLGVKHTKEYGEAISKRMKGHEVTIETRIKISKGHKGKKLSKEHKQKIKEGSKTAKWTEESWTKSRQVNLGKKFTDEHKRKISESNKGKKHTDESKRKMSKSQKRRWANNKNIKKR